MNGSFHEYYASDEMFNHNLNTNNKAVLLHRRRVSMIWFLPHNIIYLLSIYSLLFVCIGIHTSDKFGDGVWIICIALIVRWHIDYVKLMAWEMCFVISIVFYWSSLAFWNALTQLLKCIVSHSQLHPDHPLPLVWPIHILIAGAPYTNIG